MSKEDLNNFFNKDLASSDHDLYDSIKGKLKVFSTQRTYLHPITNDWELVLKKNNPQLKIHNKKFRVSVFFFQ